MNPVHEHIDGTWWFYDEVWVTCHGPYETEMEANTACEKYATEL